MIERLRNVDWMIVVPFGAFAILCAVLLALLIHMALTPPDMQVTEFVTESGVRCIAFRDMITCEWAR